MQNEKGRIQKGEVGSRNGTDETDAKHLTPSPSPQSGEGGVRNARRDVPDWWLGVPQSEKEVIRGLVASIRGLKRSKSPQISQAARKWERGIVCFIKVRLMSANGKGRIGPMGRKEQRGQRAEGGGQMANGRSKMAAVGKS